MAPTNRRIEMTRIVFENSAGLEFAHRVACIEIMEDDSEEVIAVVEADSVDDCIDRLRDLGFVKA